MKKLDAKKLNSVIENRFNNDISENNITCASAVVTQNGETVSNIRKGYSDSEKKIYRLASMTKPITAIAALIQVERGKISLEDNISKYLPDYKEMYVGKLSSDGKVYRDKPAEREIKIFNLLTHTSGLISDTIGVIQENIIPKEYQKDLKSIVDYYGKNIYLSFSPMTYSFYSAVAAFNVMSRIVELTSGVSYNEFLHKNVFEPLDMCDTVFEPTEEQWSRFVPMHNKTSEGSTTVDLGKHTFGDFPLTLHSGGASLSGTIEDYTNFAAFLLQKGKYKGRRILSETLINEMSRPWLYDNFPGTGMQETWGLGVRVIKNSDVMPKGSYGWSGAFGTHFWVDPENMITAVYMKNSYYDGGAGALTARHFEQDVYSCLLEN